MQTDNPKGWKAHVAAALGSRFKPWFQFANVTEGSVDVRIGVGGPWELQWFRLNILEIVRKAVRTESPNAHVALYIDPNVRQQRVEYLARKQNNKGDQWENARR